MSGQFEVKIHSFPRPKLEHIERVIQKHNRGYDHQKIHALARAVAGGQPQVVASYVESHVAENVVAELAYHGATAEVVSHDAAGEAT